ncbi:hypothetical protein [Streptacidiphilus albus]|nr:hypothetical protein [Streptacidiphilus albus]
MNYSTNIGICLNAADAMHQAVEPTVTYNPDTVTVVNDPTPPPST